VQNPTGELLGQEDDGRGSVEPDDDYQRDGFIVDDDDYEQSQDESSGLENRADASSLDDDLRDKEEGSGAAEQSVSQTDRTSLSRASAGFYQNSESCSDPDNDTPLNELREKTTNPKQSKAEVMSPSKHRRSCRSLNEDSDTTAQPVRKRLRRKSEQGAVY